MPLLAAFAISRVSRLRHARVRPASVRLRPIAPGNLQIMWPEGNTIIRRGVVATDGGVPDYNALVRVEKVAP